MDATIYTLPPPLRDAARHAERARLPHRRLPDNGAALGIELRSVGQTAWLSVIDDDLVGVVPYLDTLPADDLERDLVLQLLATLNVQTGLARFGLDPTDGEIRVTVVVPITYNRLDERLFLRVAETLLDAVADYAAGHAEVAALMAGREVVPLPTVPSRPTVSAVIPSAAELFGQTVATATVSKADWFK